MNNLIKKSQYQELQELLKKISEYNLQEDVHFDSFVPAIKEIAQHDFLQILKKMKGNIADYTIIDVRSEKEFLKNAIPFSINIPILDNTERHQVGLIYKQHSEKRALSLAYYFAQQKEYFYISTIKELIKESHDKIIIVYCWRGGQRSKYVASLLNKYNIKSFILHGGQKAFRKTVQDFLYNKTIPVISLSGETGVGKSEILEYIQKNVPQFPVLHLEKCAGHASSVFGEIRFLLRNQKIQDQQQFETNIFLEILSHTDNDNNIPVFLTENESKRIWNLSLPPCVIRGLEREDHIHITCSVSNKISRLEHDYFGCGCSDEDRIIAKEKVKIQLKLLNKKFSTSKMRQYLEWIDNNQFHKFLMDITCNYYDRIYKKPCKEPLYSINNRNTVMTAKKILSFISSYKIIP